MKESFPTIVDERFTANMESLLDSVEEGKVNWKTVIANFYPDLEEAVKKAHEELVNQFMIYDNKDNSTIQLVHSCTSAGLGGKDGRAGRLSGHFDGLHEQ